MNVQFESSPMASVIMSVYNTKEEYLREAIESILNQTFKDFEFIIFDDASNITTKSIIKSYHDERIVLIENSNNVGLTVNLNKGLDLSKGRYIVRMDADDVSYPNRLEETIAYLEKNKDVNILGTYVRWEKRTAKSYGRISRKARKVLFLITNAGPVHSSTVIRKSFLEKYELKYDEYYTNAQDYELWTRCIDRTDIVIYPKPLLYYRVHHGQVSGAQRNQQENYANQIRSVLFKRLEITEDVEYIEKFIRSRLSAEMSYEEYYRFIEKLYLSNTREEYYDSFWFNYAMVWYLLKYIKYNGNIFEKIRNFTMLALSPRVYKFMAGAFIIFISIL